MEVSNIQIHTTVHTLRHSYATHKIRLDLDVRIAQEFRSHTSIKTTEIYIHITDKIKSAIKNLLDNLEMQ